MKKTKTFTLIEMLVVVLLLVQAASAAIINVPGDFSTIQAAIDTALDGDEIVVAPGSYSENINFLGKAITLRSTDPADPDTVAATIVNGNQDGSVITFEQNETDASVVDGLTIRNGLAKRGGGIFCTGSQPLIKRCIITENTSTDFGGGLFGGGPTIEACIISDNSAANRGGGIFSGSATVIDCLIISNTAGTHGGGGIYSSNGSIVNSSLIANTAKFGGGMMSTNGSPEIINCLFAGNSASDLGGGLELSHSTATIINCTFTNNHAATRGGGLYLNFGSPTVENAVMWYNSAPFGPQFHIHASGTPTISYSNVQGGQSGIGGEGEVDWELGNITSNPLFVNSDGSDYRLLATSPCIDAGDNTAVPDGITTDLDGDARFVNDPDTPDTGNPDGVNPIVDMGAYEYGPPDLCADDDGDGKVTICHTPPGNPNNARTTSVNVNAVPAHLGHGDHCGPCCIVDGNPGTEDCNDNGIWDACDIDQGTSSDCDGNLVPDECQDTSTDCNENGIWDPCDIDEGTSPDHDGNGIPDECEENEVFHVDDDAPGDPAPGDSSESDPAEDGTAEHPYDEIQEAIAGAISGDTVLVAPGTYFENIDLLGKGITLRSNDGPSVTIIDAGGSGSVIKCISGEDLDTVIDGFTVTGGHAIGFPDNRGGGMYNNASSPTVTNCLFSENAATYGGGMNNFGSHPMVINCTFSENAATVGAGMHNSSSSAKVTDCTFRENAASDGAGMYNASSNPTVTYCAFIGNTATFGGGMYNKFGSNPTVTNCTFIGNIVDSDFFITLGGGMYNQSSNPVLVNCAFVGNEARRGGGIQISSQRSTTMINCIFVENTAVNNGGGVSDGYGSSRLTNCILWDNSPNQFAEGGDVLPIVRYSNVKGGWPGEGNIEADPMFVDPDGPDDDPDTFDDNNFRLAAGSPCIDAGDSDAVLDCILDLDGHERFVDDPATEDSGAGGPPVVDMGTYEFGGQPLADCTGNALPDECEPDCNGNGAADSCDIADGTSVDCNTNEVPDECDPQSDCNDNGVQDICDVAAGNSGDCNANGVPDECEQTDDDGDGVTDDCDNCNLFNPDQTDCQPNGIGDVCELADGTSEDCDDDGIPDECGLDCNSNGFADSCDIADGTSADCDGNDIPDECEADCNVNGVPDSCDIADGTSEDCNSNGIPDECEGQIGPEITQQPASQEVEVGELVVFVVGAEGFMLDYQWRKDGVILEDNEHIIGSQSPVLVILKATAADAGDYDCVITDWFGCTITSDPATLTVLPP